MTSNTICTVKKAHHLENTVEQHDRRQFTTRAAPSELEWTTELGQHFMRLIPEFMRRVAH